MLITNALTVTKGNRTQTAMLLGVSIRTVRNWIKKYRLAKMCPPQSGVRKA